MKFSFGLVVSLSLFATTAVAKPVVEGHHKLQQIGGNTADPKSQSDLKEIVKKKKLPAKGYTEAVPGEDPELFLPTGTGTGMDN